MALIICKECGKKISDKAQICIGCGCPIEESIEEQTITFNNISIKKDVMDNFFDSEKGNKSKIIKRVRELTNCDLKTGLEITEIYFQENNTVSKINDAEQKNRMGSEEFHGIYKYVLGIKTKVRCPRCNSENCSHYKEQKVIPMKTKTRYTANLNPLKPFTFVNKKEKIVRKEQTYTENKILCNDCGKIFT